jgi:hypothetical protein
MLKRNLGVKTAWAKKAWWFWPVAALVAFGLIRAYLTYNIWFNFEDQATFFIFGRNILHGEAIYKNFIHFRTPGFYFLRVIQAAGRNAGQLPLRWSSQTS